MTSKEFVEMFYIEKNNMIELYFNKPHATEVGFEIDRLGLTSEQMIRMKSIINTVLTDAMYTVLLGLDGEASIGNIQQNYELFDESGCKLTSCGEIEQYAYEYFHEMNSK